MSESSCARPIIRPLGFAAAIITIPQGIAWFILALLKIFIYYEVWKWEIVPNSYTTYVKLYFYQYYLGDFDFANDHFVINCHSLNIWAWFYLFLSPIWAFTGCCLFYVLYERKDENLIIALRAWIALTSVISLMDFILTCMLASDYDYLMKNFNDKIVWAQEIALLFLVCGTILTLAIRGFVLWIVNVTLAIVLTKQSFGLKEKDNAEPVEEVRSETFDPYNYDRNDPYNTQPNFSLSPRQDFSFKRPSPSPVRSLQGQPNYHGQNLHSPYSLNPSFNRRPNSRYDDEQPPTPSFIKSSQNRGVFYSGGSPGYDTRGRPESWRNQFVYPETSNRNNKDNGSFRFSRNVYKR